MYDIVKIWQRSLLQKSKLDLERLYRLTQLSYFIFTFYLSFFFWIACLILITSHVQRLSPKGLKVSFKCHLVLKHRSFYQIQSRALLKLYLLWTKKISELSLVITSYQYMALLALYSKKSKKKNHLIIPFNKKE